MNSTHLVGRLTRSPRLTHTTTDRARTTFTLAVDGTNGTPDYVPVTCFSRLAETVAEHTDKGHLVAVEGRLASGKYVNDAGENIYTLDVLASRVTFLSRPRTVETTPETTESADNGEAA